jgi:phytoene dehydrogenase-like protein
VTVLESQKTIGGAVRTDTEVHEGFRHDTFSAFYPLAAASPTIKSLRLEEHGLVWRHAPAVLGNPLPDGGWAMLYRDPDKTAASLDALHPGDGQAWLELYRMWKVFGDDLIGALLTPFPPVRNALRLATSLPRAGGPSAYALTLMSVKRLGERFFAGEGSRLLLAGNALHADFAPKDLGSGVFGLILAMLGQTVGFPVPQGGAGELIAALARRLESQGGTIVTGAEATSIVVRDGRAVAVRLAGGGEIFADRAVVANVSAPALYGGLVALDDLPARTRWGIRRFTWDPSTIKVDWALSTPVPWEPTPPDVPGTVHIAHSVAELSTFAKQIKGHTVPDAPLLLVGQMTSTDPSRSPAGTESLWAYTHVPQVTRSDAGDGRIRGAWDGSDLERMADRMQARLERFAPDIASRILSRRTLGPLQFEQRDTNLHGGAINGGTAALRQELVLRPVPGMGRSETPIKGLFLGSASAHPGGGVHGTPGANAAKAAIAHDRLRQRVSRRTP